MDYNFEIEKMELMRDSFDKNIDENDETPKIENNFERNYKVGIIEDKNNKSHKSVLLYYDAVLVQEDSETKKQLTKASVEYIFTFCDNCNIIPQIVNHKLNDEQVNLLIKSLDKISYPYIKEYFETKYNKANISLKLPLSFTNQK